MNNTLAIISAALHLTILVFCGILFYISQTQGWTNNPNISPENSILALVLLLLSFTNAGLAIFWPKIFKDETQNISSLPQISTLPPAFQGLFFDFSNITAYIQTTSIIRMALAESIALFGFVLAFTQQSFVFFFPFVIMGLFLQICVGALRKSIFGI